MCISLYYIIFINRSFGLMIVIENLAYSYNMQIDLISEGCNKRLRRTLALTDILLGVEWNVMHECYWTSTLYILYIHVAWLYWAALIRPSMDRLIKEYLCLNSGRDSIYLTVFKGTTYDHRLVMMISHTVYVIWAQHPNTLKKGLIKGYNRTRTQMSRAMCVLYIAAVPWNQPAGIVLASNKQNS